MSQAMEILEQKNGGLDLNETGFGKLAIDFIEKV